MENNAASEKPAAPGGTGRRQFQLSRWLVTVVAAGMSLFAILYLSTALDYVKVYINLFDYRLVIFGCLMVLTFLVYPGGFGASKGRVSWQNATLVVLSVITVGYFFVFRGDVGKSQQFAMVNTTQLVLAIICTLLLLEAIRRVAGWGMVGVVIFFLVYPLTSSYFPGFMQGTSLSIQRVEWMVYLSPEGIFGLPLDVAVVIIITFVIFAQFLSSTGIGSFFINLGFSLLGQYRGGPAKGAIVASALFGTISGSTSANVATCGTFTIPMMKKIGYNPDFAGGVEAVSSNGGQIMPPVMGAVAFIMAQMLGISYGLICLYALLPAILYFTAVFIMVDLEAAKMGLQGLPRTELPKFWDTLKSGWFYVLPLLALVFFMAVIRFTPQKSALLALTLIVVLSFVKRQTWMTPRKLLAALEDSGRQMIVVGITCAGAGIIIGSLGVTAMGLRLSNALIDLSGGSTIILLLLTALASFILGMGGSGIACYVMLAIAIAPALVNMGILPVAAHFFIFYWGLTAYISPPVAIGAYVAAAISGASAWKTGWIACRLGISMLLVPFYFVYRPAILMIGSPQDVAIAVVTSLLGIAALSYGVTGYLLDQLNWGQRILFVIGALGLISPGWQIYLPGMAIAGTALLWHLRTWQVSRRTVIAAPKTGGT